MQRELHCVGWYIVCLPLPTGGCLSAVRYLPHAFGSFICCDSFGVVLFFFMNGQVAACDCLLRQKGSEGKKHVPNITSAVVEGRKECNCALTLHIFPSHGSVAISPSQKLIHYEILLKSFYFSINVMDSLAKITLQT